jgi:hypothetical protein
MLYGYEQTTDLRYPETKIRRFTSRKAAIDWLRAGRDKFAWPGAADSSLPPVSQNWHRRLRRVFEMPRGWRPPSQKQLGIETARNATPTYHRTPNDELARHILLNGVEITAE